MLPDVREHQRLTGRGDPSSDPLFRRDAEPLKQLPPLPQDHGKGKFAGLLAKEEGAGLDLHQFPDVLHDQPEQRGEIQRGGESRRDLIEHRKFMEPLVNRADILKDHDPTGRFALFHETGHGHLEDAPAVLKLKLFTPARPFHPPYGLWDRVPKDGKDGCSDQLRFRSPKQVGTRRIDVHHLMGVVKFDDRLSDRRQQRVQVSID